MRDYQEEELIKRVEGLPTFEGWKKGMYDIWIRSKSDAFNKFDDTVYTFECCEDGEKPNSIYRSTGTSNAGANGLLHFNEYNDLGCAVLKSDIIVYDSHYHGKHRGRYNAYQQLKGFPYFRDNNKNRKAEEIGKEYNNIIGANCHKAGKKSTQIDGWSTACLVRNVEAEFNEWMKIMDKRKLSVCILKEF